MQPYWADLLAQLAALEARHEDAARLAGFADAAYRRRDDVRQANEADARDRALALATAALGDAEVLRLCAEGQAWRDDRIAGLAFAGPEGGGGARSR